MGCYNWFGTPKMGLWVGVGLITQFSMFVTYLVVNNQSSFIFFFLCPFLPKPDIGDGIFYDDAALGDTRYVTFQQSLSKFNNLVGPRIKL